MKILVIGGTGHIGSYLVPRLLASGHEVSVVSRNAKPRYADPRLGWDAIRWIAADRKAEEQAGSWEKRMAGIDADIVIDLLCYRPEQNDAMVRAFAGRIRHFLHCGTLWAYGPATRAPYEEHFPRQPITEYGRLKAKIEADLIARFRKDGFPATVVHPGHISGRKWLPIDPQGTIDGVGIYERLARGEKVHLPDQGLATLHHVHADDVAQIFERAIVCREAALGQSFSAAAPYPLSLVGCCEAVAALFGRKPNLEFVPLAELEKILGERNFGIVTEHVAHSPCASIEKARRLLGHQPRYTTEQIYREVVEHLLESGQMKT